MWAVWKLLCLCCCCCVRAHAPQFKSGIVKVKDTGVSQVTYFKNGGAKLFIQGVRGEASDYSVAFPRKRPKGTLFVDGVVRAVSTDSGTVEPFTQTKYYSMDIGSAKNITGNFTHPWSVVLGVEEKFSIWELLAFPVFSAKLHGSWWNENYMYRRDREIPRS